MKSFSFSLKIKEHLIMFIIVITKCVVLLSEYLSWHVTCRTFLNILNFLKMHVKSSLPRLKITAQHRIPSFKLAAKNNTSWIQFVKSHLYLRFKGIADTRHGTFSEPQAWQKLWIRMVRRGKVNPSGTVISILEPYFSCKPRIIHY